MSDQNLYKMAKQGKNIDNANETNEPIEMVEKNVRKVKYQNVDNFKKDIAIGGEHYVVLATAVIEFPLQYEPAFLGNKVGNWRKIVH